MIFADFTLGWANVQSGGDSCEILGWDGIRPAEIFLVVFIAGLAPMTSQPPALDQLHAVILPEHVVAGIKIAKLRFITTS